MVTSSGSPKNYTEASISKIYVKENYRDQGITARLIKEVKYWRINNGVKYFKLNVLEGNTAAFNLYKKLVFNDFSRVLRTKL